MTDHSETGPMTASEDEALEAARRTTSAQHPWWPSQDAQGTPVYFVREPSDMGAWREATPEAFECFPEKYRRVLYARPVLSQPAVTQPDPVGRFNRGDETGGAVARFGFDCSGEKPEIVPATNGAFVYYSDYLKLFKQAAQPMSREGVTQAAQDVLAERQRQIEAEGYTLEHDDAHNDRELAEAAGCYALWGSAYPEKGRCPGAWPWDAHYWNPKKPRENYVRAAALLLAAVEHKDRASAHGIGSGSEDAS